MQTQIKAFGSVWEINYLTNPVRVTRAVVNKQDLWPILSREAQAYLTEKLQENICADTNHKNASVLAIH